MRAAAGVRTAAPAAQVSSASRGSGLLQRKCACGSSKSPLGETCEECQSQALQRKLAVGSSDDPLEREADRVASQVLSRHADATVSATPLSIRRLTVFPSAGPGASASPASVDRTLAGPGAALDAGLRKDMEQRFGHDFSRVRIHTGPLAEQSARDVDAHAYTVGPSIVVDAGRFSPGTSEGRRLLAHELTHVVQQSGAHALRTDPGAAPGEPAPTTSPARGRVVQREVSPYRVSKKEDVLDKIQKIVEAN